MPLDAFLMMHCREKIRDFIIKYLTELGHETSVDDLTNRMIEIADSTEVFDKKYRTVPEDRAVLRREVVNIVRVMAHHKKIVMVSDDRFTLPGQPAKYRTLDDFWES